MGELTCPYCGAINTVVYEDGHGLLEYEEYKHECSKCDKKFSFYTMVTISHIARCNPDMHEFDKNGFCKNCGKYQKNKTGI